MNTVLLGQDIERLVTEVRLLKNDANHDILLNHARILETQSKQAGIPQYLAVVRINMSEILYSLKEYQQVITLCRTTLTELGNIRQSDIHVRVYELMSRAYTALHDWQNCRKTCEDGISIIEQYRYEVSSGYLQSAYLKSRINLYANAVYSCFNLHDEDAMLRYTELSKSRAFLGNIMTAATDDVTSTSLEDKLRQVEMFIEKLPPDTPKDIINAKRQQRRSLYEQLQIHRTDKRTLTDFNLADFRQGLQKNEACLNFYWISLNKLIITLLSRDISKSILQSVTAKTRTSLEEFSQYILSFTTNTPRGHLSEIEKYSEIIFPQALKDLIPANITRLIICPHRLLHTIPIHAIYWQDKPLIYRFSVRYIPNLSSHLLKFPQLTIKNVLAMGIQDYHIPGKSLSSITTAESEILGIKNIYNANHVNTDILLNHTCTEEHLRNMHDSHQLDKYDCLHLNMHGENINGDTPIEANLYLYDSILDGMDIPRLGLGASIVVLSACCSGQRAISGRGMNELPGDELFGLQAAFFSAGTRVLLASLWPVESSIAKIITLDFHFGLAEGMSPDIALQKAIIHYLDSATSMKRAVYYWASFFIATLGNESL